MNWTIHTVQAYRPCSQVTTSGVDGNHLATNHTVEHKQAAPHKLSYAFLISVAIDTGTAAFLLWMMNDDTAPRLW